MSAWKRHRLKHPRNCDRCPPRTPAMWNLDRSPFPMEYLCDMHARKEAEAYGIMPPPAL